MKQIIQNLKTGETILDELPAPVVKRGQVLVRTTRSLISLGTEKMLVEFGQAGLISKARQQPDKVKQVLDKVKTDGLKPTLDAVRNKLDQPLPLGYCNVGEVIAVGADVHEFKVGDRVVSNGNHAEVVCVPKNLVARIPDGVSDDEAAFTVVASIGLQGIRLVNPTLGETVVVVGLGLIGILTCQLLKANGCKVIGYDYDQSKVDLAASFGVRAYNSGGGVDPVKATLEESGGVGADAVIITASTPSHEVIHQAAEMSRKRGRIVLVGVIGLNLSRADFYKKELSFQVSCSYGAGRYDEEYETKGHDYPLAYVRWTEQRNFEAILEALASGSLVVEPLITKRVALDQVTQVYSSIDDQKKEIGILIEYPGTAAMERTVRFDAVASRPVGKCSVAVVGTGNFSQAVILPSLAKAGADLAAVVSSKGVSGNHAARKFGARSSSTDYAEVLNNPAINTVVIGTPHNLHAKMVEQGLRAQKHLFVEKPLAIDRAGLQQVEQAYRDNPQQQLMVGFNRRFASLVLKLKELLKGAAEPLNMIFTANAGFIPADHWTRDMEIGGGRIIGEACHFIDLLASVCNSSVTAVCASALGQSPDRRSDNLSITLKFANGSQGTVHYFANGAKSYAKERMEVYSEGRVFILDNFRKLSGYGVKGFKSLKLSSQDKGHAEQFKRFVKTVEQGGPPLVPFEQLLNSSKAAIAAVESIETGGWVEV